MESGEHGEGNGLTEIVRPTWARRWVSQEWAEVRRSVRSACVGTGPERETLVQSLKAAAAAIAAWAVSGWWFQAPMALLAPWTAIAMVGSTVYQSLRTGIQQFAIIALGTLWASAAMAFTRDQTMVAMLLTLPFMMLLGNYRRFGSQGIYGATTALFVITGGVSSTSTVGHRLLETLIGAVIGLLVNAFVLPPVHLRSVRDRLVRLARETADVLGTMAEGLGEEDGLEKSESWHHSAGGLTVSLQNVSEARRWAMEGSRWNPGGGCAARNQSPRRSPRTPGGAVSARESWPSPARSRGSTTTRNSPRRRRTSSNTCPRCWARPVSSAPSKPNCSPAPEPEHCTNAATQRSRKPGARSTHSPTSSTARNQRRRPSGANCYWKPAD